MNDQIVAILKPFYKGDPGVPTKVLERFGDLASITSTSGVAVGEVAFISGTSAAFERAADAAGDAHYDYSGSGGVKWYENGPNFSTRARAVAAYDRNVTAGRSVPAGTVWSWPGAFVVAESGATVFSDLIGFVPSDGKTLSTNHLGIVNSATLDQGVLFQTFITTALENNYAMRVDVQFINCGGREIWFNKQGNAAGYEKGNIDIRGAMRRVTQIRNGWFTFGKTYTDLGSGGSDIRFSITTDPITKPLIQNLLFEGVTRFINCEGAPTIRDVEFWPETNNATFYDAMPDGWGQNLTAHYDPVKTDTTGAAVTSTAYTDVTHVLEVIACNHIGFYACTTQNGSNVSNIAGDSLGGVLWSGTLNPLWMGGRTTNSLDSMRFETHPVYDGQGTTYSPNVIGLHPEENEETNFYLSGVRGGYFNLYGRSSSGVFDNSFPFIYLADTGNGLSNIHFDIHLIGTGNSAGETCFQMDAGENIKITGRLQSWENGLDIQGGSIRPLEVSFDDVTNEVILGADILPYVRADSPQSYSEVASQRNLKRFSESWTVRSIDAILWDEYLGSTTAPTKTIDEAGLTVTLPAGTPYNMTQGHKLGGPAVFKAEDGVIEFETTVDGSSSATSWFVGLIDNPGSNDIPISVGAGDTATLITGAEVAGFYYTSAADTDHVWCTTVTASGTPTLFDTNLTFTAFTGKRKYRVRIEEDGDVKFFIDGVLQTTASAAVSDTVALAPTISCHPRSSSAQTITFGRVAVEQVDG